MEENIPQQEQIPSQQTEQVLPADELKRLSDFFSVLIQIDQRNKRTNNEAKNI